MQLRDFPTPWLKHYPEIIDWDMNIPAKPLYAMLEDAAEMYPLHDAIEFFGQKMSYHALAERVNALAYHLQQRGVKPGVCVGILLPNCPQFIIAHYAILKAGGTVVQLSPLCAVPELEHQIRDADVHILITANLAALYKKIQSFADNLLETIFVSDFPEYLPSLKRALFRRFKRKEMARIPNDKHHIPLEPLLKPTQPPAKVDMDPKDAVAVIQYTGGTTGVPKGVLLTHYNLYANAVQSSAWCAIDPVGHGRTMAVLPFFHAFAMTTCMNFGILRASTIIMQPKFVLKDVLLGIHKSAPTVMPGVPTMFNALAHSPLIKKYNLRSIKSCISGGAPLPLEVKQRFEEVTGCVLVEGYGLTEASPVVCANPLRGLNKAGSIGLPLPRTYVLIEKLDAPGHFQPIGSAYTGELCVAGPQVMKGYHNKPEDTAAVLAHLPDGTPYLRTGDIACIDNDGYVHIVDRKKDVILVGGFNVYPRHVEEVLYQHEAILEAAVIGIADEYKGEAVKAFVALKEGAHVTEEALRVFLAERLGKYQLPSVIEFRSTLPKTPIGKIDKKPLRLEW